MLTADLDIAIKKVCPIYGVSIGNPVDKTTWRIDFDPSATPTQQSAAQAVVTAFDPNAPSLTLQKQAALAFLADSDIRIIRHMEEVALGQTPFLSAAQLIALYQQRQTTRAILSQ